MLVNVRDGKTAPFFSKYTFNINLVKVRFSVQDISHSPKQKQNKQTNQKSKCLSDPYFSYVKDLIAVKFVK